MANKRVQESKKERERWKMIELKREQDRQGGKADRQTEGQLDRGTKGQTDINSIFLLTSSKISDVEMGGATVFTRLGISLKPIKSAAVFWYNLYRNGNGNVLTEHAACPVLKGTKWGKNRNRERQKKQKYRNTERQSVFLTILLS
jgi:hypothetical protein